jgi:hypothetical protein
VSEPSLVSAEPGVKPSLRDNGDIPRRDNGETTGTFLDHLGDGNVWINRGGPGSGGPGRVTQGGCPPRVPTDPDMRVEDASGSSPHDFATRLARPWTTRARAPRGAVVVGATAPAAVAHGHGPRDRRRERR